MYPKSTEWEMRHNQHSMLGELLAVAVVAVIGIVGVATAAAVLGGIIAGEKN